MDMSSRISKTKKNFVERILMMEKTFERVENLIERPIQKVLKM